MTVPTDDYAPTNQSITAEQVYTFPFLFAEESSIEVYELYGAYRYLVPVGDYQLDYTLQGRIKAEGVVTFKRPHRDGVTDVRIERNTLITQLTDFPKRGLWDNQMVEFCFDKLTMIIQEIAERKCLVSLTTPATQEIIFGRYWHFPADDVGVALVKIFDLLQEIADTAEDCRSRPEDT